VEAMIFSTPMIVTYRVNPVSAFLAKRLVKVNRFCMVNIIANDDVVPELYQDRARPDFIAREAIRLFKEGGLDSMRTRLSFLKSRLGSPGVARRVANQILGFIAHK
jgi:lipid-A-disaccharide synthase